MLSAQTKSRRRKPSGGQAVPGTVTAKEKFVCNLCGGKAFKDFRQRRKNAQCATCRPLERHRAIYPHLEKLVEKKAASLNGGGKLTEKSNLRRGRIGEQTKMPSDSAPNWMKERAQVNTHLADAVQRALGRDKNCEAYGKGRVFVSSFYSMLNRFGQTLCVCVVHHSFVRETKTASPITVVLIPSSFCLGGYLDADLSDSTPGVA